MLDGIDTASLADAHRAGLRSERIGFVFQSFHLLSHRSAVENVMLGGLYQGIARRVRRDVALEALDRVGLSARSNFLPTRLSGGERQRVAVARALAARPSLMLCDEPTGNLDSANTVAMLDLFDDLLGRRLDDHGDHPRRRGRPKGAAPSAHRRRHAAGDRMRLLRRRSADRAITEGDDGFDRRSRLRIADLFDETLAGVFARPGRAALTTAGTVIGLASLVATLGISRTAGNQIVERFDELQATQVSVRVRSSGGDQERAGGGTALPWDVEHRLDSLNGVVAAGAVADVANPGGVRTVPVIDPSAVVERTVPVVAASSGFLDAVARAHLVRPLVR